MGNQFNFLQDEDFSFIKRQKVFFIASSSKREVNLSPKGYNCLRVINSKTLIFLDYPGSGNRTALDIIANGNITFLFTAFEGKPKILRLFCKGILIEKNDKQFPKYLSLFDEKESLVRRLIKFNILAVEYSCGMSVPIFEYKKDRIEQKRWLEQMVRQDKLREYIKSHKNRVDLDL